MNTSKKGSLIPIIGSLIGGTIALTVVQSPITGDRLSTCMQLATACISGSLALAEPQNKKVIILVMVIGALIAISSILANVEHDKLGLCLQLATSCISSSIALAQPQKDD